MKDVHVFKTLTAHHETQNFPLKTFRKANNNVYYTLYLRSKRLLSILGYEKKSLIALAFGTLGLGIAEFVMMGILPDIAKDLHISIATAGHLISAYALGVCVGAPMLIIARRYPLKHILLVLVGIMMIGNLCAALAF